MEVQRNTEAYKSILGSTRNTKSKLVISINAHPIHMEEKKDKMAATVDPITQPITANVGNTGEPKVAELVQKVLNEALMASGLDLDGEEEEKEASTVSERTLSASYSEDKKVCRLK